MIILKILGFILVSLLVFAYVSEKLIMWRMGNYMLRNGNMEVIDKKVEKRRTFVARLFLIGFIVVFILGITSIVRAEPITWKMGDNPTVERCMSESEQSREVCTMILQLAKESERTGEIAVGTVVERKVDWIDLSACTPGNDDDICQGRYNPLDDKYKREFIPEEPKLIKGKSVLVKNNNGLEMLDEVLTDGVITRINKSDSILVPDVRYIGDGKYCYPVGSDWKCEE